MKHGCDRIIKIFHGLRTFSRLDEAEMKPVDIQASVGSSLLLLNSRINSDAKLREVQIIKEYGDLPNVTCYAAQLNQVFFNLFSNAIDALAELRSMPDAAKTPQIQIRTETYHQNLVRIFIRDNGSGIPESVKAKMFDPFFTTKPVGQGTGLGLSTSYQIIVQQHGGQLTCQSNLGQGAEFIIEIPINPKVPV
jgi:signal transduction histidine kinase